MTEINGRKYLTILAETDEVYKITYNTPVRVSMLNITTDDILVGESSDFVMNSDNSAGLYFTLPPAIGLNELSIRNSEITVQNGVVYVKAKSDGKISIVRCSD